MSANARIYLPHDARIKEVAYVIALSSGLTFSRRTDKNGTHTYIPGLRIETLDGLDMIEEIVASPMISIKSIDGHTQHSVMYFFESSEYADYSRALYPKSTPYWLAIGKRLITFFGGMLIYRDDKDSEKIVFPKPSTRQYNPEDDDQYSEHELRYFKLSVLSEIEIEAMRKYAAYP